MNTDKKQFKKHKYCAPHIECVKLDNEISLALESLPPAYEKIHFLSNTPEYLNDDPFKIHSI